MSLGSNNPFPKVRVVEMDPTAVPAATSGEQKVILDTNDHCLKRKDAAGALVNIEGHLYSADPADLTDNRFFMVWTGGSPTSSLKLKIRRNGQTIVIQEWIVEEDT